MQETIEYHPDEHGGFYTTSLFWACSCDEWYIHPHTQAICQFCGDRRGEGDPDAHVTDVLRQASDLDKHLVAQLEEALDAIGLDIYVCINVKAT
ncbi:MAG TPA: hypothetical protein PKM21_15855 [Anaerolineales bacterium]|nr:hypothetical protein [Anaerolineales bacterium]